MVRDRPDDFSLKLQEHKSWAAIDFKHLLSVSQMVLSSGSRSHLVLERPDFLSHMEPHWENKVQGTLKHTFQGGFSPRTAGHREGRGQGHSTVEVARGLSPSMGSGCHILPLEGEKQVWQLCHRCLRARVCQGLAASSPSVCPSGSGSPLPVTISLGNSGEKGAVHSSGPRGD